MSAEREADAAVPSTLQVVQAPAAHAPVPARVLASATAARVAAAPLAGRSAALERVQAVAGQLVPHLQYQIMRLGTAGQAGLAALVGALAVAIGALVPAYHALQMLNVDIARAQHPSAVNNIEQAIPHLVASLPTRAQIPALIGQVVTQAKEAGVSLDKGHYLYVPPKSGAIAYSKNENLRVNRQRAYVGRELVPPRVDGRSRGADADHGGQSHQAQDQRVLNGLGPVLVLNELSNKAH